MSDKSVPIAPNPSAPPALSAAAQHVLDKADSGDMEGARTLFNKLSTSTQNKVIENMTKEQGEKLLSLGKRKRGGRKSRKPKNNKRKITCRR